MKVMRLRKFFCVTDEQLSIYTVAFIHGKKKSLKIITVEPNSLFIKNPKTNIPGTILSWETKEVPTEKTSRHFLNPLEGPLKELRET